jgi:hypothetical protein
MGIGDNTYYLRFEDRDVQEIEHTFSLFVAFHPVNRTYENASVLLWRGLRLKDDAGNLTYAIQQGPQGKVMAFEKVKEFTRQFTGTIGMALLYGYFERALVSSGWFGEEKKEPVPVKAGEPEQPKNLVPPMNRRTKKPRSVSAGLHPTSSDD